MGATGFRANVGEAWTGSDITRLPDGSILIRDARRLTTGLPAGFSDLFGLTNEGRFFALEVKAPKGRVTDQQANFLRHITDHGGIAGVARSVDDARLIIKGRDL